MATRAELVALLREVATVCRFLLKASSYETTVEEERKILALLSSIDTALAEPEPGKTVRAAVCVDRDGEWGVAGDSNWDDAGARNEVLNGLPIQSGEVIYYVTAEVPLPQAAVEVEGECE